MKNINSNIQFKTILKDNNIKFDNNVFLNICKRKPSILNKILNSPFINQELFNKQDNNGLTCLHFICSYHSKYLN